MSNITSSAYPVVTVTKAGDQFTIVQGGQLKKLTRQGLADFITSLAPNTLISLSDVPGSYVGQAGKALVVKGTEDGVEFELTTAGNFNALSDTPASKAGQAGKVVAVNGAESALEYIDQVLTDNTDFPSSYSGQGGKVLKVKVAEDGVEFAQPVNVEGNFSGGFFDYNHGGGTQSYTGGSGDLILLNDEAGPNTQKDYAPPGVTDLWDASTNRLDFSELELADMVGIRIDIDVTTTATNQEFELALNLAIGTGIAYTIPLTLRQVKAASTKRIGVMTEVYVGNVETRDNPGSIVFSSPSNATIQVRGWYIRAIQRGIEGA